ncbi:MAG: aspartate-semialdehyde dehydrogenase, partial [Syntrophomonadaceae bacterium]|nr:aspartate-semialdehyde dehydrogenase [Syntrophomonadaceae bacterium]
VALVGATGAVGQEMLKVLEERDFPVSNLKALADPREAGSVVTFQGKEYVVEGASPDSFSGCQIALFAAGEVVKTLGPAAVKQGAVVIDNSSTFRMDPTVPLVVPEVNPQDVKWHRGIIANPNCSTIIMVVPLKPLHDAAFIKRIVVSTYQAVSGAGRLGLEELEKQVRQWTAGEKPTAEVFPYQIAFNLIPHIDVFEENDYTKEELKMVFETRKIMHEPGLRVSPTAVRVPVFRSHSESINIETERKLDAEEAKEILSRAPGVILQDDPSQRAYPMPLFTAHRDEVFVGRVRNDESIENGLNLWVASDQIRKGAATNAVQIAELLLKERLI